MKSSILQDHVLVERAVNVLMKSLGPVETTRFLAMSAGKREESVRRHRRWQKGIDKKLFLDDVFGGNK